MEVNNILDKVKELVRKGNVSKIVLRRKGEVIVSIPVNVGIVGAVVGITAAKWAILAAALATVGFGCSVEIVKDDGEIVNVVTEDDTAKAKDIIGALYEHYISHPDDLPPDFQPQLSFDGIERTVLDYIAGMTDKYAVYKFSEIFIPTAWQVRG